MTEEKIAQARWLFGPAPILSSEELERFEEFFTQLANGLKPQDVTEVMLIWQFTVDSWRINRATRHAAVAIERRYEESLQHQAERAKFEEARRHSQNRGSFANCAPTDIARLATLEEKAESAREDVHEILTRKASELDHNRAFEKSIVFQEQLDKLITSAARRRDDTLKLLELYRTGLGAQATAAAEQILDGECQEVIPVSAHAPALVPPDEGATDDAEVIKSGEQ